MRGNCKSSSYENIVQVTTLNLKNLHPGVRVVATAALKFRQGLASTKSDTDKHSKNIVRFKKNHWFVKRRRASKISDGCCCHLFVQKKIQWSLWLHSCLKFSYHWIKLEYSNHQSECFYGTSGSFIGQAYDFCFDNLRSMGSCIQLVTSISPNFSGDREKSENWDPTVLINYLIWFLWSYVWPVE